MNFLEDVLFYIFPKTCEFCGKIDKNYLCEDCKQNLEKSKIFLNEIQNYSKDKQKYFTEHAYIFSYDAIIREKLIKYKFNDKPYLSKMFYEFFRKNKKICGFLKKYDIIIPVPMTKNKLKQRGYNQAKLIAEQIAKNTDDLSMNLNVLIKCKENKTQSKLNKLQRIENVKNVYKIQNERIIKNKNILIFDDIYTTGSTCNECAKILKEAGCNEIGVITIAKELEKDTYFIKNTNEIQRFY